MAIALKYLTTPILGALRGGAKVARFGYYSKPLYTGLLGCVQRACALAALLAPYMSSFAADSGTPRYAGPEVCAKCHKEIAAAQSATAMAKTWDAASTLPLPPGFHQKKVEGPDPPSIYEVRSVGGNLEFSITDPNGSKLVLP